MPSCTSNSTIRDMFINNFLSNFKESVALLKEAEVEGFIKDMEATREKGGRVFIAGVGGSAANSSHMVNDLRKLAQIEAYSVSENVSEITARINDEGWDGAYAEWLRASRFSESDLLCVLSVGGGNVERNVSMNLVAAIVLADLVGARVCGVVGRSDGFLYTKGFPGVVLARSSDSKFDTPVSETLQALVWHLAVSDPRLQRQSTKW